MHSDSGRNYVQNRPADFQMFWGEMSPSEHFVQIYERDVVLMDALEGFISGGLRGGESAIVIATPGHRTELEHRLRMQGFNFDAAVALDRYIALDAAETLLSFMDNGWPDEKRFMTVIHGLLERAGHGGRPVRAFGEMVALLWAQGHSGATVRLEHLWHGLCAAESFALFCAYPKSGFTMDAAESLQQICATHSKVISRTH
ncbi:MAG TPA: MEDS domain-containing protein [Vicinamibacterales bacterium]|nr:MEDS domain-containing protein [Vicinamibacterales bacterium]